MRRESDARGMMVTVISCPAGVARRMRPRSLAQCLGQLAASIADDGLPAGFDAAQLGTL